eukprot:2719836-Pyramimonas_sp.AAC.1
MLGIRRLARQIGGPAPERGERQRARLCALTKIQVQTLARAVGSTPLDTRQHGVEVEGGWKGAMLPSTVGRHSDPPMSSGIISLGMQAYPTCRA